MIYHIIWKKEMIELTDNIKYFKHNCKMSNIYFQLNTIFGCWSSSLQRQSEFFNQDFLIYN